jgi:hypothetical protein
VTKIFNRLGFPCAHHEENRGWSALSYPKKHALVHGETYDDRLSITSYIGNRLILTKRTRKDVIAALLERQYFSLIVMNLTKV